MGTASTRLVKGGASPGLSLELTEPAREALRRILRLDGIKSQEPEPRNILPAPLRLLPPEEIPAIKSLLSSLFPSKKP